MFLSGTEEMQSDFITVL